jgi:hypothetical protein
MSHSTERDFNFKIHYKCPDIFLYYSFVNIRGSQSFILASTWTVFFDNSTYFHVADMPEIWQFTGSSECNLFFWPIIDKKLLCVRVHIQASDLITEILWEPCLKDSYFSDKYYLLLPIPFLSLFGVFFELTPLKSSKNIKICTNLLLFNYFDPVNTVLSCALHVEWAHNSNLPNAGLSGVSFKHDRQHQRRKKETSGLRRLHLIWAKIGPKTHPEISWILTVVHISIIIILHMH